MKRTRFTNEQIVGALLFTSSCCTTSRRLWGEFPPTTFASVTAQSCVPSGNELDP